MGLHCLFPTKHHRRSSYVVNVCSDAQSVAQKCTRRYTQYGLMAHSILTLPAIRNCTAGKNTKTLVKTFPLVQFLFLPRL
jgi:hypothetical protein